ncbi:unnamed protein product, partial [Brassica napus]
KGRVTGAKSRKLRREEREPPEPEANHIMQKMPSCAGTKAHQRAKIAGKDP